MRRMPIFLIVVIALLAFNFADAQIVSTLPNIRQNLSVEISPNNPGPFTPVDIRVNSYYYDLNQSDITWVANGQIIESGFGKNSVKIKTGSIGDLISITVLIKPPVDAPFESKISIIPEEVDLIWESEGYAPAFYPGKRMYAYENPLRVLAMPNFVSPNGQRVPQSGLVYKWTLNRGIQGSKSGLGKNQFVFTGSRFNNYETVGVEVSSPDGSLLAKKEITINPTSPLVLFYEKSPLYGIQYQNGINKSYKLEGQKEVSVVAVPYFFGVTTVNSPDLQFNWRVNGQNVLDQNEVDSLTLRNETEESGTASVSLNIRNSVRILQSTAGQFLIEL